jgi:hypothetical protein
MDTNYPVEIVVGLLVLLGLLYLARHEPSAGTPQVRQAVEHVVPMTVPTHK